MKEHIQNFSCNQIWMLEHDAVFTLGTAADESHIINAGQIPVIQTDRGGEVTYHGPGQLVIYFLIDIKEIKLGPKALVQKLQELISSILGHYDIESSFIEGAPGVYVDNKKIASIGLRISQGKTYHGISINVAVPADQHSDIFGHMPSSHTVLSLLPSTCAFTALKFLSKVALTRIQSGFF